MGKFQTRRAIMRMEEREEYLYGKAGTRTKNQARMARARRKWKKQAIGWRHEHPKRSE